LKNKLKKEGLLGLSIATAIGVTSFIVLGPVVGVGVSAASFYFWNKKKE